MSFLLPALYTVGLYSAYIAGSIYLRTRPAQPPLVKPQIFHIPKGTFFLLLTVGIPTTLQFFFPVVLSAFQRDYTRFLHGDWWRLITPLFVQDGGVSGAIFNLVSLLLVGRLAEQFWGSNQTPIIFFIGGIIGEIVAFAWQPIGAGNSIANFSLAASVAIAVLMRYPSKPVLVAAFLSLCADGVLVMLYDIHGVSAIAGAMLGFVLSRLRPEQRSAIGKR